MLACLPADVPIWPADFSGMELVDSGVACNLGGFAAERVARAIEATEPYRGELQRVFQGQEHLGHRRNLGHWRGTGC